MIIDCAHYQDGRRQGEGAVALQEAAARRGHGGFVWLGLFEPGMEELAQVRDTLGLHELAVADAQTFHMRPKVQSYDGGLRLVILRTARYDDEAEEVGFGETSVFLAPTFVITVRQGVLRVCGKGGKIVLIPAPSSGRPRRRPPGLRAGPAQLSCTWIPVLGKSSRRILASAWICILWRCWTDRLPYDPARHKAAATLTQHPSTRTCGWS